jgi:spore coat polysaccharide biosynthesis protein SpsF
MTGPTDHQHEGRANAFIQARMSSSRLPGKVMLPLAGTPMLWHVWDRAARCEEVHTAAVITSTDTSDDLIEAFCAEHEIPCFRGSLEDVLDRYRQAVAWKPCDYAVRITADCPLIEPTLIDERIRALRAHRADLTWFVEQSTVTGGQSVFSRRILEYVADRATDPKDREHVGGRFVYNHLDTFRVVAFHPPPRLVRSGYRITVDEADDYLLTRRLYEALRSDDDPISLQDALRWLDDHPDVKRMNADVQHDPVSTDIVERSRRWEELPKAGEWKMT